MKQLVQATIGLTLMALLGACVSSGEDSAIARPDDKFRESCPFSIGNTVADVQEFYNIDEAPEKLWAPKGPASQYRFREYGVWIFFNEFQRIEGLRFNEPYKGSVRGLQVGDSISKSKRVHGEPDLTLSDRWTYNFGRRDYLTFDFDADRKRINEIYSSTCS